MRPVVCGCFLRLLRLFGPVLLIACAHAQLLSVDNTTAPPTPGVGHDYIKMLAETVNPANGSVSLRIDLPLPPGRGLKIPFALMYNSSSVMRVGSRYPGGGTFYSNSAGPTGGWSKSIPTLTAVQASKSFYNDTYWPPVSYICTYISSYNMTGWSGSTHPLNISIAQSEGPNNHCDMIPGPPVNILTGGDDFYQAVTTNPCPSCIPTAPTPVQVVDADGTVFKFTGSWSVDGTFNQYYAPQSANYATQYNTGYWGGVTSIEDRNGNVTTFSNGSITDDAGRQVVTISNVGSTQSISVLGQTAPYTVSYTSAPHNFSVTSTILGDYPSLCRGIDTTGLGQNPSVPAVQTLTLPNGKYYQFFYDSSYGLLRKIVYPDGGYVSYTWGVNRQSEIVGLPQVQDGTHYGRCFAIYDLPAITQRTVSYDGTNIAEIQQYHYATTMLTQGSYEWTSKTTTVVTTDIIRGTLSQTTYTYTPMVAPTGPNLPTSAAPAQIALEQSIAYHDFNGAVLKTDYKGWGACQANC